MSHYTQSPAIAEPVGGGKYRLASSIVWHVGSPTGPVYVVPVGFVFDVSVPWYLTWLFSPDDPQFFKAAALHDRMLSEGWSRVTAGAEFHNALAADGVSAWKRLMMWLGVSLWRYGEVPNGQG